MGDREFQGEKKGIIVMKLPNRVRRPRPDYLLDNAAALNLGKLFLGWKSKKGSSKKRSKKVSQKAAKETPTATNTAEVGVKKPASSAKVKSLQPEKLKTSRKAVQGAALPSSPNNAAAAAKPLPRKGSQKAQLPLPKITPLSGPAATAKSSKQATHRLAAAAKPPGRPRGRLVPIIPNPVPTPAMSPVTNDATSSLLGPNVITVTVRTMSGSTFRVVLAASATLTELKQEIVDIMTPDVSPLTHNTSLPMLVMNGKALMPDTATLSALRFSTSATVYCFPDAS